MGPFRAGALLDAVDLATWGPIGLYGGFVLGGIAGAWAGRELGLSRRACVLLGVLSALYSMTPATELVPLGMLVGAGAHLARRIGTSPGG